MVGVRVLIKTETQGDRRRRAKHTGGLAGKATFLLAQTDT